MWGPKHFFSIIFETSAIIKYNNLPTKIHIMNLMKWIAEIWGQSGYTICYPIDCQLIHLIWLIRWVSFPSLPLHMCLSQRCMLSGRGQPHQIERLYWSSSRIYASCFPLLEPSNKLKVQSLLECYGLPDTLCHTTELFWQDRRGLIPTVR